MRSIQPRLREHKVQLAHEHWLGPSRHILLCLLLYGKGVVRKRPGQEGEEMEMHEERNLKEQRRKIEASPVIAAK